MKKILLSLTLLGVMLTASAFAQKMVKAYACPKCEVASMKAAKCCDADMMAVKGRVAYVCTHCNMSKPKAGDCACGMKMQKSLITYGCEACKVSSNKAGDCKMCKGKLKKHIMPIKG